jgi:hypothetical protein
MPSGGKGHDWIQSFDTVHAKMQAFWGKFHHDMEVMFKNSRVGPEDARANLAPLELCNSAEHLRLIGQKREEVLAKINRPKAPTEFDSFLPLPTSNNVAPSRILPYEPKVKIKTKGESSIPIADNGEVPAPAADTFFNPKIPVTRKALSTFRTMFPFTAEERAKSTEWDVFVGAMIDAGFSASCNGGSAFSFGCEGGKIVFHKPHPDPRIHPNMLQWIGRRLNKWFGWDRETFVVDKK